MQYRINDPDLYLHRLRNQTETIRDISESVMRRIVGNRIGSNVLTVGRVEIAVEFEVDLVVLSELIFCWKEPVIGEEAHIAEAEDIVGHGGNIEMTPRTGNGAASYKILI